jgi:hypothetical protein
MQLSNERNIAFRSHFMEHEQELENLKSRIASLDEAQVRMWRAFWCGTLVALAVGVAALPPHLIRWGVIALAVLAVARYCPYIADAIRHQMHRSLGAESTNASSTA